MSAADFFTPPTASTTTVVAVNATTAEPKLVDLIKAKFETMKEKEADGVLDLVESRKKLRATSKFVQHAAASSDDKDSPCSSVSSDVSSNGKFSRAPKKSLDTTAAVTDPVVKTRHITKIPKDEDSNDDDSAHLDEEDDDQDKKLFRKFNNNNNNNSNNSSTQIGSDAAATSPSSTHSENSNGSSSSSSSNKRRLSKKIRKPQVYPIDDHPVDDEPWLTSSTKSTTANNEEKETPLQQQ